MLFLQLFLSLVEHLAEGRIPAFLSGFDAGPQHGHFKSLTVVHVIFEFHGFIFAEARDKV
jgi:hypothetical protein